MDKIQVIQYVVGSSLFTLIIGYTVGRVLNVLKYRRMKANRDLHLKSRIKAEEKTDEYKGKYLIYNGMAELGQTPK